MRSIPTLFSSVARTASRKLPFKRSSSSSSSTPKMSSPTVVLITGANRGLGKGFVETYLARNNTTVVATVRDPASAQKDLETLPKGSGSSLIVVKLDSQSTTDPAAVVSELEQKHKITYIDVVIANAGISKPQAFGPAAEVKLDDLREHLDVNAIAPFLLYQATLPLLKKAAHAPGKFVGISSPIGSIGGMEQRPYPMTAYGVSKAALNWVLRKIHFEHEDLITFAVDPGFVQTDLGNTGARFFGMKEAYTPTSASVAGSVKVIDEATRENTSGKFPDWEGGAFPW